MANLVLREKFRLAALLKISITLKTLQARDPKITCQSLSLDQQAVGNIQI